MKKREIYEFLYGFIDSKDIAEYLGEIEYSCDDLCEAAYIVQQSSFKTLDEKFEAFDYLVDTMPDSSMAARYRMQPIESCKSFIQDYRNLLLKGKNEFYDSSGCIYTYEYLEMDRSKLSSIDNWRFGKHLSDAGRWFDDMDSALAHFKNNVKHYENSFVIFRKHEKEVDPTFDFLTDSQMLMNHDLEVISIIPGLNCWDEKEWSLFQQFRGMGFVFPLPFKRGDILIDIDMPLRSYGNISFGNKPSDLEDGPFVLDYCSSWDVQTLLDNGFGDCHPLVISAKKRIQDIRDNWPSDAKNYFGYYLFSDYHIDVQTYRYGYGRNLLKLEWYNGSLKKQGLYQMLGPISESVTFCQEKGGFKIEPEILCFEYLLSLLGNLIKQKDYPMDQILDYHNGNVDWIN